MTLWIGVSVAGLAPAQTAAASPDQLGQEQLEREFTDPLTTLPQLIIRDGYSPAVYGTHIEANQAIIRLIVPR